MAADLLISMTLGLFTYWIVKIRGEINSPSPVTDFKGFVQAYAANFTVSLIGLVLIVLNGPNLNFSFGDYQLNMGVIDGVAPAFFVGGAIPSIMNNVTAALLKKSQ